jgi:hypothetical protein
MVAITIYVCHATDLVRDVRIGLGLVTRLSPDLKGWKSLVNFQRTLKVRTCLEQVDTSRQSQCLVEPMDERL